MKHVLLFILTYLAAVLQAGGHFQLPGDGGPVAFLPLVFVLAVFLFNDWRGIVWAGGGGLVSDCLKADAIGVDMLCAVLVAGVALRMRRGKRVNSPVIVNLLFAAGMVFAFGLLSQALSVTVARETANPGVLLSQVIHQTGGTLTAGLVFVLCFNAVVPLVSRNRRSMNHL
jgi:rod shape-determining protein MreD